MEYVSLGKTGAKISPIILGTMQMGWRIDEQESFKIMDRALELGINCFDTANIYTRWSEDSYAGKTEEIIGRWLADRGSRDELILASKLRGPMSEDVNNQGLSRRHIHQALHGSLERLQTDWIDLYQIHSFDTTVPIEETLHGLNIQIDQGLVNYIGASNVRPWHLIESFWMAEKYGYQKFETLQPPYSLVRRDRMEPDFVEIVRQYGTGIIPYSPLGGGFLTGKYQKDQDLPDTPRNNSTKSRYFNDKNWNVLDLVQKIAEGHEATITQVALAWVLSKDYITAPIIGANSVEQLEENVGALEVNLSEDELTQLDDASALDE